MEDKWYLVCIEGRDDISPKAHATTRKELADFFVEHAPHSTVLVYNTDERKE